MSNKSSSNPYNQKVHFINVLNHKFNLSIPSNQPINVTRQHTLIKSDGLSWHFDFLDKNRQLCEQSISESLITGIGSPHTLKYLQQYNREPWCIWTYGINQHQILLASEARYSSYLENVVFETNSYLDKLI